MGSMTTESQGPQTNKLLYAPRNRAGKAVPASEAKAQQGFGIQQRADFSMSRGGEFTAFTI